MHCVVTGVAGFVGSTICERLLKEGHTVTGIDCFVDYYPRELKEKNLATAKDYDSFTFLEENLLATDIDSLLDGAEWVFHQAAQAGVRASWGEYFDSYTNNNVLATQRLLEGAKRSTTLKKIVYASSSSVYGNAEAFPTSEEALPQPVSPYGVTKLAAEHLMTLYASQFNVPTASLRYFTVYGPRQRPDMAFTRFIKAALQKDQITLYGDGEQSRDFTYIDDIVSANILAAEKGAPGGVYNIGGGTVITVNEILKKLEEKIGTLNIDRQQKQAGDARRTSATTERAKSEIGYQPTVSLDQGIDNQISWLQQLLKA